MKTLIAWMDSTPWIDKYFYYGMCEQTLVVGKTVTIFDLALYSGLMNAQLININPLNALMNQDGTPTPLGKIYIGA
jgi:hypothetical protein